MEYEKRIVCYMDILGFKNMIEESSRNADIRNSIFQLLQDVKKMNQDFQYERLVTVVPDSDLHDGFKPKNVIDMGLLSEMSFFSDSIIFSYKMTQARRDLYDIVIVLQEIARFAFELLLRGFFVRGGLSYGEVYHNGNVCFGPALVTAVLLEEHAVYPRISIDPLFFNDQSPYSVYYGKEDAIAENRQHIEDTYHCVDLSHLENLNRVDIDKVRTDNSLIHYLDYLDIMIDYDKKLAMKVKGIIEKELQKDYPDKIAAKYQWMKEYYNSTVYNTQCMGDDVRIII